MKFYEVLVASQRYHGDKALTYGSDEDLAAGQVVMVPLQRQTVAGIVVRAVSKPSFAVKPISNSIESAVPPELIRLADWLHGYYPAPLGQVISLLLPASIRQKSRTKQKPAEIPGKATVLPPLTARQTKIVESILKDTARMHLLHGETGSGKTRVYIELMKKTLAEGRSCLLLTPEIGLTPQLTETVEASFPGRTTVLHSELTPSQRRNRWIAVAGNDQPQIIIGPRSALFAPVRGLGYVIVDEAHDDAYKQEQAPHYQTTRVAAKLGELHQAKVILGSATPLVSDYFTFKSKNLSVHVMPEKAIASSFGSSIDIVSLRERSHFTRSNWLSVQMLAAIDHNLSGGLQSLIFLNRRGSARLVSCQDCGWQALCPRCDLPLTYHGDSHHMQCHTCGYRSNTPASCPQCNSSEITFRSIGTKAIVGELERLYPKARILRFDSDVTKADRLEAQYDNVRSGKTDIIVGTQMLAKGLDLPKLGMVGVVLADTAMYFPDYTADERTFQLLRQVSGRVDRGHRDTKVIVQTYHPESTTLQHALNKDYEAFYETQLKERQAFGFPPYRFILKLRVERASLAAAERAARQLAETVRSLGLRIEVSDPAPAFIEKTYGRYRWQLIIKSVDRGLLVKVIAALPANIQYDIDPTNLL